MRHEVKRKQTRADPGGPKNWQKSKRIPSQLSSSQLDRGIYKEEELTSRSWSVLLGQAEGVVIDTVRRCVALAIDASIHRIVDGCSCGKGPGKPPIQSPVKGKQNKSKKNHSLPSFFVAPSRIKSERSSPSVSWAVSALTAILQEVSSLSLVSSSFSLLLFPSHSTPSRKKLLSLSLSPNCATLSSLPLLISPQAARDKQ